VAPADTRAAADSVGAADVFVLRRVSGQRFVQLGGCGRGEGWAGIVEVSLDDELPLSEALKTGRPVKLAHDDRELVFGPYYARAAAVVPVLPDIVVVFGAGDNAITPDAEALHAAANTVAGEVEPAGPAKRLADELEVLEAIRATLAVPHEDVEEALAGVAGVAAEALSCELGIAYLEDAGRIGVAERGWHRPASDAELASSLAAAFAAQAFPQCVQDARSVPPPGALANDLGIRSYYLLELTGLAKGVLFVAHTDAAPRGFTLLCRRLGLRLAEVASSALGVALTREWIAAESARLQSSFAALEG
jgi:hypothetical protein